MRALAREAATITLHLGLCIDTCALPRRCSTSVLSCSRSTTPTPSVLRVLLIGIARACRVDMGGGFIQKEPYKKRAVR